MKKFFLDIETKITITLVASWRNLPNVIIEGSKQIWMIVIAKLVPQLNSCRYKKNQLIGLQESLELFCNVLPVFGFNSAKYDLNLIKSYLLPILINEEDIEPTVIKKANQFISIKFGDFQLLDLMNFLGGATSLNSFVKAYKTSETKGFSPTNDLITLTKGKIQNFPHMTAFTVNFVAVTLLKPNTRTMLIY